MIDYIYDIVRVSANSDFTLTAYVSNENAVPVEEGCKMRIYDDEDNVLVESIGTYNAEEMMWSFPVYGEDVEGVEGKRWYAIFEDDETLCFQKPIYFMN